jgi:hypothetical protein
LRALRHRRGADGQEQSAANFARQRAGVKWSWRKAISNTRRAAIDGSLDDLASDPPGPIKTEAEAIGELFGGRRR